MIKTAIILSIIHLLYYAYVGIIYQFVKMGTIYNTPNKEVFRLRSLYNVSIKTFRKTGKHYGFSLGKTIYLNESLFKTKKSSKTPLKALQWTFHHEYYHLKHHRKKMFLMRIFFSLIPLMLMYPIDGPLVILTTGVIYVGCAYYMGVVVNNVFERQADDYANKMIKI